MKTPTIRLRCLKKGCPRTRKVARTICQPIPDWVAEIHMLCPWHERHGDKAEHELWYDAKGNWRDELGKLLEGGR